MKANQQIRLTKDTRAQVGIGTMIVFIATILVAATAAAVLLDTSGKLQERSSSTGNEATKQVASNLVLKQAVGKDGGADALTSFTFTLALAPGASQVDLQEAKIRVSNGDSLVTYDYAAAAAATKFTVTFLRGTGTNDVMLQGDLVNIAVPASGAGGDIAAVGPRSDVTVLFIPEVGSHLDASFTTPASWAANENVILR